MKTKVGAIRASSPLGEFALLSLNREEYEQLPQHDERWHKLYQRHFGADKSGGAVSVSRDVFFDEARRQQVTKLQAFIVPYSHLFAFGEHPVTTGDSMRVYFSHIRSLHTLYSHMGLTAVTALQPDEDMLPEHRDALRTLMRNTLNDNDEITIVGSDEDYAEIEHFIVNGIPDWWVDDLVAVLSKAPVEDRYHVALRHCHLGDGALPILEKLLDSRHVDLLDLSENNLSAATVRRLQEACRSRSTTLLIEIDDTP